MAENTPLTSNLQVILDLVDEHARDWMRVGQSGSGYVYDPNAQDDKNAALKTTKELKEAVERLTRERDTAREALRISEQRVREHWPERDRLRAALTRLTVELECGRNITHYCSNCDCSLFDAAKIAREALSGEHSERPAVETEKDRG